MIVMFIKLKSHAFDIFKWYKETFEKETGKPLKILRSHKGGEFISICFTNFCVENGSKRELSTLRTQHNNDIDERRNRYIMDCERTLMIKNEVS